MNKKLSKIALDILGIILALICLSPFYIIIVNSFKTKGELFESTLALPEKFNLDNYTRAWEQLDFIKVLGNSLFITVISIVFIVLFASMAAWMLQRTNSKISNMILFIFISSMLVTFQSIMLPLINIMGKLNLLNVPGIIFMYIGFGSASAIFLYHGFVKSIPKELDEAALIDGCINQAGTRTIPLSMFFFFGQYTKQWDLALAGLVLTIIPVLIFYFFAQKHIIKSVTVGSIK